MAESLAGAAGVSWFAVLLATFEVLVWLAGATTNSPNGSELSVLVPLVEGASIK